MHLIKYEDFEKAKVEHILASSVGKEGGKRLVVFITLSNLNATYEIIRNGVVDYQTSILERAVEYYNETLPT